MPSEKHPSGGLIWHQAQLTVITRHFPAHGILPAEETRLTLDDLLVWVRLKSYG
jgi:hypothetical protein